MYLAKYFIHFQDHIFNLLFIISAFDENIVDILVCPYFWIGTHFMYSIDSLFCMTQKLFWKFFFFFRYLINKKNYQKTVNLWKYAHMGFFVRLMKLFSHKFIRLKMQVCLIERVRLAPYLTNLINIKLDKCWFIFNTKV